MSMSGGGSKQESKPLTPEEMQGYYDVAMKNLSPYMPTGSTYNAPTQQTLTGGDYNKLREAYTAPIDREKALALKASDQAMSDRGIYSSLNAVRNNSDVAAKFAPQYAAAEGQAINQKANELNAGNTMAMANAQAATADKWRPADYLAQLWGSGKGQTSSGFAANGGFTI